MARNCSSSQRMGSLKSAADFFARAPPSLCNSVHSPPRAHPPRASCSRFAWTLPTKANSRSFGELKRSHSVRAARNSSRRRSTHGFSEFFLGFEVVVDIAYRHASRLGDVRQTRLSETSSIRQLRRSLNQPRSLVRLCRSHIVRL